MLWILCWNLVDGMLFKEGNNRVQLKMGVTSNLVVAAKINRTGAKVVDVGKRNPVGGVLTRTKQQASRKGAVVLGTAFQTQQMEGGIL